jgi:LPXTG-motif cell wall-anchored protein
MRTFDTTTGQFLTGSSQVLVSNAPVAPANIGPRSTPNYEANLAAPAIRNLAGGGKVFAGPRDDPFYVDLGSAFDLLGLRPLNPAHLIPLGAEDGVDGVAGYNVHTTAIQVPISSLGLQNGVMGVWAASKRQATRVINQFDGTITWSGAWVGISRLGMPLVNEVVVPLAFKDVWNFSRPDGDGRFGAAVTSPEMTGLMNLLYPPLIDTPTTGRDDLVTVFLTGVPGVNQLPIVTPSEMIRLNTTIPPSAKPDRLGVTAGDNAGFPNGRRLLDDVVDIELRALACSYGVVNQSGAFGPCTPSFNAAPNNILTDGLDANEKPFSSSFPYMAEPYQGYEAQPPTGAGSLGVALAGMGMAAAAFLVYRRRKHVSAPIEEAAQ